ncbi:bifunctional (p)ppGpp synthetase/guanosine-3',5'-bis(diphosphate) 3'-pyrophosphohydrolase, partial [bacterium]|nr:bifunctional (p)ppGpp synthetase/guanosine-3',5'-bis(diphosphate) 3'-pyrophosphohydrolase [bacterium]
EAYIQLVRKIKGSRKERERYVDKVKIPLFKSLEKSGIKAYIEGRAKHFNSVYRKMKRRNCSFEEIYDLFAVRIIVDKLEDCYYALGIVHTLFPPIRERFKDFIATPKLNGYQSIHTTVIGLEGKRVEIQIRTHEMHFNADLGITAHWRYKQGKTSVDVLDKQLESIRAIIEGQDDTSPTEFIEYLKIDLFQEEVFVFTPKGDMIRLPVGATPIDFAFEVHTDIGLHCIGAKINGRVEPLNTQIQSGDTIEILTTSTPRPNPNWITLTKTSKARRIIKKWIKDSLNQQSIELGKELLLDELKSLKIKNIDESLSSASKKLGFNDIDAFYGSVGRGETTISSVAKNLPEEYVLEFQKKRFIKRMIKSKSPLHKGIRVLGVNNVSISLGECCNPIPGDKIQGVIPKGVSGVVVHRIDCSQLLNKNNNLGKFVPVVWEADNTEWYSVGFKLVGEDRKGFLKDIVSVISDLDANIVTADIKVKDSIATNIFLVEVLDLQQLTAIIRDISRIKGIISVERFINNNAKLK